MQKITGTPTNPTSCTYDETCDAGNTGAPQTPQLPVLWNPVVQKATGTPTHPKNPTYEEPLSCRKPREPQGFLTIRICTTRAHHKYNLWDLLGCPLFLHHEFSSEVNFVAWVGTPWFSATQSPPQYRSNVVCSSNSEIP